MTPLEIIEETRRAYKLDRFVGFFSGGKDSYTACHYLADKGIIDEVLYCQTNISIPEHPDFIKKICKHEGWKLNAVEPLEKHSYTTFVQRFGFPKKAMHNAVMSFLKWYGVRRWLREHKDECIGLVTGRRPKESWQRMKRVKSIYDNPEPRFYFTAPLFEWDDTQVWDYVRTNRLELSPGYQTLHMSGDCLCGAYSTLGEAELINIFYPQVAAFLKDLEDKCNDCKWRKFRLRCKDPAVNKVKWGNQSSITGSAKQQSIESFMCEACISQ